MPRYYQQAVTAVELPDDIFGYLPELAIMIMNTACLLPLIADFDQALLCGVLFSQHSLLS